jgi:hypothetical protein
MEIAAPQQWYFCDDIWEIIKDYMGVSGGIKPSISLQLSKFGVSRLAQTLYMAYDIGGVIRATGSTAQRKALLKAFYTRYRLLNRDQKEIKNGRAERFINSMKFSIPEDLTIGEEVLVYKECYIESPRKIGKVHSIARSQFTVKLRDGTLKIVKSNKFIRKDKVEHHRTMALFD